MRILILTAVAATLNVAAALNVAVTGATGRVGRLVVRQLLDEGHAVTALVRTAEKAKDTLPNPSTQLTIREVDLGTTSMQDACQGAERLIWCASGFSDAGESIDQRGMAEAPSIFAGDAASCDTPVIIMLSSAGVTRPTWDEDKKQRLSGAADIPIIRLNPGGILGKKKAAEDKLRASAVPYTVLRPTGLKFEGWPRGRPILSQGDVAVGRTNADDLAEVLVSLLTQPAASGKTIEMFTLAGYPPARSLSSSLDRLADDSAGAPHEAVVQATYDTLQQLLPGENQDATQLEMGRTYEQVDQGAVEPRASGAAPTERELALASTVSTPTAPPPAGNQPSADGQGAP